MVPKWSRQAPEIEPIRSKNEAIWAEKGIRMEPQSYKNKTTRHELPTQNHRERQRDKNTERQRKAERQTDKQTDGQMDQRTQ